VQGVKAKVRSERADYLDPGKKNPVLSAEGLERLNKNESHEMTTKLLVKQIRIILTLLLLSIALSCTDGPLSRTTKITDILTSPSKYGDGIVRVKGKVTESFIVFGQGYFMIADGTGAIAVVPSKTYPKVGEEVTIRGHVENAFVVGDKSLTVIIENSEK